MCEYCVHREGAAKKANKSAQHTYPSTDANFVAHTFSDSFGPVAATPAETNGTGLQYQIKNLHQLPTNLPGVGGLSFWGVGQGGGGVAQGLGNRLFAFGGAYRPLATAHSDPLWARTCFGCVNGAPG